MGDVPNVTFPCGATIADDGDGLNLYYGAADTSIGLATGSIGQILSWFEQHRCGHGLPTAAEEAE